MKFNRCTLVWKWQRTEFLTACNLIYSHDEYRVSRFEAVHSQAV